MAKAVKQIRVGENLRLSIAQHAELLDYINKRLLHNKLQRDTFVRKLTAIDRQLAGFLELDPEDKKRELDNLRGRGPQVTDTVLGLTFAQLHEALTFIMSVVAPEEGIYQATAPAKKQHFAKGFTKYMNKMDTVFDHYGNLARGVFDSLKYNMGGFLVEWREVRGKQAQVNVAGSVGFEDTTLFSGDAIEALDMYNFIWDPTVDPVRLPEDGEYFGLVSVAAPFKLLRQEKAGRVFGVREALDTQATSPSVYYKERPRIFVDHSGLGQQSMNWFALFGISDPQNQLGAIEVVHFYCWINPKDFGLSGDNEFQLWRFTLLSDMRIIAAVRMENAHGMLPCVVAMPLQDGFQTQTKTFAEYLRPFNDFASFQMNVHQRAARKKVLGVTLYNSRVMNLDTFDPVGATIPFNPPGMGTDFDIRKHFAHITDGPDTRNTIEDIDAMNSLMQKILPTDMMKQVTDLQRATQYQAAAAVQGANRRNYLITKMINSQALQKLRMMLWFDIIAFSQTIPVLDEQGNTVELSPKDLMDMELLFGVTGGLKGLDKLIIIEGVKDIINMLLQSKVANDRIDVVKLIDYFSTMIGDNTDFKQFQFETKFDALTLEEKEMAFSLLQQVAQPAQPPRQGELQQIGMMMGEGR